AATMSSMDSGLNKNSGIFVKNFYEPVIRANRAPERELMWVSKITSAIFGVLIILTALFIQSLKGLSLFDTMMYVGALLSFPMLIPAFLGFFIKRTPDWAGWSTLLVGALISYIVGFVITPAHLQSLFALDQPLTAREWSDAKVVLGLAAHIVFTGGYFLLTCCFYRPLSSARQQQVELFFNNLATPLINNTTEQQALDNKQRTMLGRLITIAGFAVMTMMAIPNPLWGRAVFALCGGIVLIVGLMLIKSAQEEPIGIVATDAL
ncbi:MAG: transporter, partial [Ferrimonas sp.]